MINLLFFGDFVCQSPQSLVLSQEVRESVSKSDVVYCNFEAPVEGHGNPIKKSGPALTQSALSPSVLEGFGFNLIGLSNNHMMDMGVETCKVTMNSFHSATIIGAGEVENVYKVKKIVVKGTTLGFLSLTHKEFGTLSDEAGAGECGTAWINSSYVNKSIINAKKECDFLFILPHAGIENEDVPLPEWRFRYHEFVDLGADAVIASHPHVPQGWETYKGAPIFYSLGNFVFDSFSNRHGPFWNKGLAVQISIDSTKALMYEVLNVIYEKGGVALDETTGIKEHNHHLCLLLENEQMYKSALQQALTRLWRDEYQLYLLRGLGAFTFHANKNTLIHSGYGLLKGMDVAMLINNFQCESHRWAIERILRNKM